MSPRRILRPKKTVIMSSMSLFRIVGISKDALLQSGNSMLTSIWVEEVTTEPTQGLGGEYVWICPSLSNNANDISGHGFTGRSMAECR